MTNSQVIEWCLNEKQQLKGNKTKGALRRVVMLWKIQDEAAKRIDRNVLTRWGVR